MRTTSGFLSLLLLGLGLVRHARPVMAAADPPGSRPPVADFTLKDLRGKRVSLRDHLGKRVVVVSFWATWCVPCKQELALLQKLYKKHKKRLSVLAVATDGPDTFSRIRGYVRRHRWTFPVLPDTDGSVASVLNPRGVTPYALFVDRSGRLAFDHEGFSQGDQVTFEAQIKKLLAEPPR